MIASKSLTRQLFCQHHDIRLYCIKVIIIYISQIMRYFNLTHYLHKRTIRKFYVMKLFFA